MTAGQLCPGCECDLPCGPGTCECPPGGGACPRCAARREIIVRAGDRTAAVVRDRLTEMAAAEAAARSAA